MFILGLVFYIGTVIGLLLSTSLYALYGFLVLGGISETGRYYVAYVYVIEVFPKRLQNLAGLGIFVAFATSKVLICCYFWLSTGKNWKLNAIVAIVMATLSLFLTIFFVPESPRYLYSKGKKEEAKRILRKMQLINKKDLDYQIDMNDPKEDT